MRKDKFCLIAQLTDRNDFFLRLMKEEVIYKKNWKRKKFSKTLEI